MPPQNARRGRMIGTQLATPWVSSQRVSGPHSTAAQADVRAAAPASVTAPTGGGDVGAGVGRPEQAAARTKTTDARRARDNIARIVANTPYASADSIAAASPWRVMRSSSRRRPCASQRAHRVEGRALVLTIGQEAHPRLGPRALVTHEALEPARDRAHEHPAIDLPRDRRHHVGAAAARRGLLGRVEPRGAQGIDDVRARQQPPRRARPPAGARIGTQRLDERAGRVGRVHRPVGARPSPPR
jgi:hypothetical protein